MQAHFLKVRYGGKASFWQAVTNKTSKQINLIRWAGGAVSDEVYAILSTGNFPIMGQNMGQAVFEKIAPNFLNNKTKKSSGNLVASGTFMVAEAGLVICSAARFAVPYIFCGGQSRLENIDRCTQSHFPASATGSGQRLCPNELRSSVS